MPRLITRYIFREMAAPFLLSVAVLSVTALLGKSLKLVELFIARDVGLRDILWLVLTLVPSFLIYTLPASMLVAVLLACTRLSSDSEIIAMKSSGLSLFAVVKPVFLLAVLTFATSLIVTVYLYPWGNHNFKKLLFDVARKKATAGIEEKTFYDRFKGMVLYVDRASGGGELEGVFISERADDGGAKVILAEKGSFISKPEDLSVVLNLKNGSIHSKRAGEGAYHIVKFAGYTMELGVEEAAIDRKGLAGRDLYLGELLERKAQAEIAGRNTASYVMDFHRRFAMPAAVFAFAIIGVPLGMQRVRSARTAGFGLAIGVILAYHVLSKTIEALGSNGIINPALSVWGSDIVIGAAGLVIFYRALREKPVVTVIVLEDALHLVMSKITGAAK
ncbi:MAG: LPS export ABC transporter permease LptF [Deltaproteobacteria bacterium]|nr:LPS export ABC transporter permease LptF [Deltaproteobacteria bacterium]